ncbi:DUF3592 domain-containing protein [Enemella evansiae]|uniref:DUF3592 domain-containing protein n=1 Tax=Enemella evansiae TaxID=2016499 RepID=A0A255GNN7_9ACTN|nr:DUF3592 domain-containing protein [Enemella evansiae]OYO13954.1 hypothetical protein CGZ98_05060 [Enemella evansiae]OYO16186.1 hypothetical protein CGZ94_05595 [Enemella evansiae]OYO18540.1 hypothetical protein BI335_07630 [Enemella evansiae]TDO84777.1 uncharacterized protein DUF3592 [Enemella evansiae]
MSVTAPQTFQSPARRLLGRLLALVAIGLGVVALVLSAQNLYFHSTTQAVAGEVVAVQPVIGADGRPQPGNWQITVEFADSNGQYRRFDQTWSGTEAPQKGDQERVWFSTARPADARVADWMQLWWQAVLFAAGALIAGIAAEELGRRRPRRGRGLG